MKAVSIENLLKKLPLPEGWSLQEKNQTGICFTTDKGQDFRLDFTSQKALSHKQPLAKAVGFKGKPLKILDLTAGWAKEAFLLAKAGCQVRAVESHPFVFYFVQASLLQKKISLSNLKFTLDNSFNYLKTIKETDKPDVIYMDPMFQKKSLSQKPLLILKQLVGETKDKETLFQQALTKAKKRVVVKRHRLETPFQKPLCSFKGRSACYDVFSPLRGEL